jgi:hypothetical protein
LWDTDVSSFSQRIMARLLHMTALTHLPLLVIDIHEATLARGPIGPHHSVESSHVPRSTYIVNLSSNRSLPQSGRCLALKGKMPRETIGYMGLITGYIAKPARVNGQSFAQHKFHAEINGAGQGSAQMILLKPQPATTQLGPRQAPPRLHGNSAAAARSSLPHRHPASPPSL